VNSPVIAALVSSIVPLIVGLVLRRHLVEIHAVVNSRLDAALSKIADLESTIREGKLP